ncbi:hypothetical protein OFN12_31595, partial [Escherichia coli]|nr:hypothetical protein [Escherichia coli]
RHAINDKLNQPSSFMKIRCFLFFYLFILTMSVSAQATGGPGADAVWLTAAKEAVGTSATLKSKVWFTLARGVMTEAYYPDVTT